MLAYRPENGCSGVVLFAATAGIFQLSSEFVPDSDSTDCVPDPAVSVPDPEASVPDPAASVPEPEESVLYPAASVPDP